MRLALQSLGVTSVWEASDGREARALYARNASTIVFLDVTRPTMPGAEASEGLAELDPNANVVIITAEGSHHTVRKSLELGVMGYVLTQRPPEEFRRALREQIAQIAE